MPPRSAFVLPLMLTAAVPMTLAAQAVADLPARDRPIATQVTDVYAIGGLDAPDWAAFGSRLAVAFDPSGQLIVLDSDNRRVLVVAGNGRLVREFGREGDGPGEFQLPADLAVMRDGSIVVLDRVRRRLMQFSADGTLRVDADAAAAGIPRAIFPHPRGGVIGDALVFTSDGQAIVRTSAGVVPVTGRPIRHYLLAGDSTRLLHSARLRSLPTDARGQAPLTAFFPEFTMAVLPDGRAVLADSGAYVLTVVAPGGGVQRLLRRGVSRVRVTDRMRDAERQRLLHDLAEGRPPEGVASFGTRPSPAELAARHRRRIEGLAFPEFLPAVQTVRADHDGRIWVERYGSDPHAPGPIDVITADGSYLGTIPAGQGKVPLAFGPGGLAAFLTVDELDVPTIHVRRVRLLLD